MAHGGSAGQATHQAAMNDWRQAIETFYPDWDHQTYCVPPLYLNRLPYDTHHVAGLRVLKLRVASSAGSPSQSSSQPGLSTLFASCCQSVSSAQPTSSSQPTSSAQPTSSSQPTSSAQPTSSSQPTSSAQPISSSLPTSFAQPTSKSQPTSSAQPTSSSQPTSSAPPTSSSQPAASALPTSSSQPSAILSFSGEPARVQKSDTRDDFAQQHVMHCVQTLGETQHEPMFVISQLKYADYLNKPAYAQAAQQLPRPFDLPRRDRHGDFDILIPHMRYGILIGEIKSVGQKKTPTDAKVSQKVKKAVNQLNKSERVVRHITQDMAPGVRITNTLIFPYVTSHQMQQVIMADRSLQQAVCATLGAPDVTTAVQLCLCADQLSDQATPHDVTPHIKTQLSGWFMRRVSGTVDPAMTRDVYINMLARLVGPATTIAVHCVTPPRVEVRTLGEAVSELGERLARVVLTPGQLHLINQIHSLPRVCLAGPPGTGKSLVLVLVGLHWLRAGHDVLVLSTSLYSRAVSHVIQCQLEMTLREDPTPSAGTVRFLHCDLTRANETDVKAAVTSVAATATLHLLMDEANFSNPEIGPRYRQLVAELFRSVPGLSLWAATMYHTDLPPGLHVEALTVPLRSAPVIAREVGRAVDMTSGIHGYTTNPIPSASDGPAIIRLRHEGGQHAGRWPIDCHQCGREVAHVLRHQLRVGVTGPVSSGGTTTSPPPLQYRDVLVLTRDELVFDELTDEQGNTVKPASAFVAGLRDAGFPVSVISCVDVSSSAKVTDMAAAQTDQVNVAYYAATHGLERKVVVYLPGRVPIVEGRDSDEEMETKDSLLAVSRCSSQLVMVDMPPAASTSGEDGFHELMERVNTIFEKEFATTTRGNAVSGATASTAAASADEAGLLLPDEIKQIMKAMFPTYSSPDHASDNNGEDSPLAVGATASTATTSADEDFLPDPIKQFIEKMKTFATPSSAEDNDDDGNHMPHVTSGNEGSAHYIAVPMSDSDLAAFMQEVPRMMMQFETTASNADDTSDNDGGDTPPAVVAIAGSAQYTADTESDCVTVQQNEQSVDTNSSADDKSEDGFLTTVATAGTTRVTADTESHLATVPRQIVQSAATTSSADAESDNDGEGTPAAGATATASDSFSATDSDLKTLGLTNSSPTNISDDHGGDTNDEDGNVSDSGSD